MVAVALFTRNPDRPREPLGAAAREPCRCRASALPPLRVAGQAELQEGEPRRPCRRSSPRSCGPPIRPAPGRGQLQQRGVEAQDRVRGSQGSTDPGRARVSSAIRLARDVVSSPRISRSRTCRTWAATDHAGHPGHAFGRFRRAEQPMAFTTKLPAAAATDSPDGRRADGVEQGVPHRRVGVEHESLLDGEVVEDGLLHHTGALGDLHHADGVEAALGEQLGGRVDDPRARLLAAQLAAPGVRAPRRAARRRPVHRCGASRCCTGDGRRAAPGSGATAGTGPLAEPGRRGSRGKADQRRGDRGCGLPPGTTARVDRSVRGKAWATPVTSATLVTVR